MKRIISMLLVVLLVLCAAYICLLTRCSWFNGVFESSIYCLSLELGKSLCRDGLLAHGLKHALPGLSDLAVNLILLALYLAWLGALCVVSLRHHRRRLDLPITMAQAVGLLFPLFLYLAVRFTQYDQMDALDNLQWFRYDLLQYAVAVCALLVMSAMESMLSSQAELNELANRQLLMEQNQRQYELQRDTIEFINRRCHDMKHTLNGIELILEQAGSGRNADLEQAGTLLGEMRQSIDLYGDMQKTGSPVMDVLLFQKMRECRQKDILLTPVIDASRIGFISTLDLSALFGNAVDNAIEAVQALEDPELRHIRVKIGTSDGLLLMRFHNRCRGERRQEDGRFVTTKADAPGHGYGLQNITAIAESYGGSIAVDTAGGEFTLHVMIPLPDGEQEGVTT